MPDTSKTVCASSHRSWTLLTLFSAGLFIVWLAVGGYRWEGYPCFVWKTGLAVRFAFLTAMMAVLIYYWYLLFRVVIDPTRFTHRAIVLTIVSFTLLRIILGSALPLLGDEAYHWLWPGRLDWCYYDHGGLLGWLCYPFWIVSKSVFFARLGPIIMGTITAVLTWFIARWITNDEKIANRALAALLVLPVAMIGTTILFTDTPLAIIWLAALWVYLIAVKNKSLRWWLLLGLILGLGLNTKFLIFGLIGMLLIPMLIDPQARAVFKTPGPYLAAIVAIPKLIPLIYWNATHDWQTFTFNFVKRGSSLRLRPWGLVAFSIQQIILIGPLLYVWNIVYPGWWSIRKFTRGLHPALPLVLTGYVIFMLYGGLKLFRPVNTSAMNWTPPLFPLILIVLAWGAAESKWARRGLIGSVFVSIFFAYALVGGLIGEFFVGPDPIRNAVANRFREQRVRHYLADFFGWYPVGKELDLLHQRYSASAPIFILARTYMHAAQLTQYTSTVPLVLSMGTDAMYGRCFDYWNEPEKQKGKDCLFVANHEASTKIQTILKNAFESVRELNPSERIYVDETNKLFHIYYCRQAKYFPGALDLGGTEVQN